MDRLLASRQSLAEALRAHGVVPVIGPEAVLVETDDAAGPVPFYGLVCEALARTYGTVVPDAARADAGSAWLLHRTVAQVLADGGGISTERVRRSVSSIVKETAARVRAAPLLDRLARLRVFDLYVCLTPDDLLAAALRRVLGDGEVDLCDYAPSSDSSVPADVVPARPGAARVYFPLGRVASGTRLAIHEEDTLEYFYRFQEDAPKRAPRLLDTLRQRDLLLLGCNLPDWLGLAFIRLANEMRLSAQDKKMEFFAADAQNPALNSFLARFNPNATVFPWTPEEFVGELEALAAGSSEAPVVGPVPARAAAPAPNGTRGAGPTIFVSYASEDRPAALALSQALVELGFADVWLDRHKLIAGDDWSDRIDDAIEHCDFFMPVLSLQADRRREGVFWIEWRKALARAMRVHDAFVLPVGVDPSPPDRSGYERIFSGFTSGFRELHLVHAPGGVLPADVAAQFRSRVAGFLGGGSHG